MKVNNIFHWLYFLMLLLPISVIPIFAIFTRNENSTFAQEITVQENEVVEFNQLFHNDLDYSYTRQDGAEVTLNDYIIFNYVPTSTELFNFDLFDDNKYRLNLQKGHKYYLRLNILEGTFTNNLFMFPNYYNFNEIFTSNENISTALHYYNNEQVSDFSVSFYFNAFDLTQMFGSGNEPTKAQFDTWYPNQNYVYNNGTKQLLKDVNTVTYNDTDIGSQFTYTIYNTINKYFNYDKVFNFGDLYDWLQLNFFSGNAPIGFFIFWHYLIYFLLTSLLWLLFDVLMYVPNFIHKWLDKAS